MKAHYHFTCSGVEEYVGTEGGNHMKEILVLCRSDCWPEFYPYRLSYKSPQLCEFQNLSLGVIFHVEIEALILCVNTGCGSSCKIILTSLDKEQK